VPPTRCSTSGFAAGGVAGAEISVAADTTVGAAGFAAAMLPPATSAVSDAANGNKNERFFMWCPKCSSLWALLAHLVLRHAIQYDPDTLTGSIVLTGCNAQLCHRVGTSGERNLSAAPVREGGFYTQQFCADGNHAPIIIVGRSRRRAA
jgi:hypothetical protein